MALATNQQIFAWNVSRLIKHIYDAKYKCTLGEAYRTQEQAQWDAEHGTGIANSLHCDRLAIDLNLFSSENIYLSDPNMYKQFGAFWETLHPLNRWGGNFPRADGNHFEMNVRKELHGSDCT
jgi:D-alanyl-D-alanine carboxypeptidase